MVTIFVFDLVDDHVAAIGDGVFSDNLIHRFDVRLPGFGVSSVVVAKRTISSSGDPAGKASPSTLGIDVGSWSVEDVQAEILADLEQTADIMSS